jgi:hypothetical protein
VTEAQEKWAFVIETLMGGLDYQGICKWLACRPNLDTAYADAQELRLGTIAT